MEGTDFLCNLPGHLTAALSRTGFLYGESLPFVSPKLELSMVWLSVMDTDPAERWLRKHIELHMGDADSTTMLSNAVEPTASSDT
jgi:LysR family transcriptional activator of mexEF-oprN operon